MEKEKKDQSTVQWVSDADKLRRWFYIYLLLWLGGLVGVFAESVVVIRTITIISGWALILCLIPYVVSIVYAYKVQKGLKQAGLYKHGAWQVIVAALFFNPWLLGAVVPLFVLAKARKFNIATAKLK